MEHKEVKIYGAYYYYCAICDDVFKVRVLERRPYEFPFTVNHSCPKFLAMIEDRAYAEDLYLNKSSCERQVIKRYTESIEYSLNYLERNERVVESKYTIKNEYDKLRNNYKISPSLDIMVRLQKYFYFFCGLVIDRTLIGRYSINFRPDWLEMYYSEA